MADISKIRILNTDYDIKDETARNIIDKQLYSFGTLNEMTSSTLLKNGDFAKTLGFYEINDGGSALYKIKKHTDEVVNNYSIFAISNTDLIAELIIEDYIDVKQFGAYGDNIHDDTIAIQKALDSNYDVYFPNGTYKVSSRLSFALAKKLIGENKNNTKIKFNDNISNSELTSLLKADNITGITIDNLTFDFGVQTILRHSISFLTCKDINIINCVFSHGYGYMFRLNDGENILFENCSFKNINGNNGNPGGAIYGQNIKNIVLENVQCYEIDDHLLYVAGITLAENIRISNCYSYKTGKGAFTAGASITLYANTKNAVITNCTFEQCRQAIHLSKYDGSSEVPHDITISNCTILNSVLDGIYLEGYTNGNLVRNILINNVIITGTGQDAISLRQTKEITISNCSISNITRNGVDIRNSQLVSILNNIIKNCTICIILAYSSTTAENCIIKNNLIYATDDYEGNKQYGIYNRSNSHNAIIENNKIFGFTAANILAFTFGTVLRNQELDNSTTTNSVKSLYYASAQPTSGYFEKGTLILNSSPAVGSPIGWLCTVTGSPATFVALANL